MNGGSDAVWLTGNRADDNAAFGLVLGSASDAHVIGNSAQGNDIGIFFFDLHDSVITANLARSNRVGLVLTGGQFGSDGNRLTANSSNGNDETGIAIIDGADDNVLLGNSASGNRGSEAEDGGLVVQAASRNVLIGNFASANLGSGIAVLEGDPGDTTANSLTRNVSNGNNGRGIDAVTGSIDGGGNRASGNATPPQCVNVSCPA